ncbi:hypothetical protein BH23BAC4_BH23BAC4_12050 [soil metagenome]
MRKYIPLLVGLMLALPSVASAQILYHPYQTTPVDTPGPRIGIGGGAFVYDGPARLNGIREQGKLRQTSPAVFLSGLFPLNERLGFRAQVGLAGFGNDAVNVTPDENPFVNSTLLIPEAHLVLNLLTRRQSPVIPYLFGGIGAVIADPFNQNEYFTSPSRTLITAPLGIGLEIPVARNLSFFLDATYRIPLNTVGTRPGTATFAAVNATHEGGYTTDPAKFCKKYPDHPNCRLGNGDERRRGNFNSGSLIGGLLFGFGAAPAYVVPPPYIPPPPVVEPVYIAPEVEVVPERAVCPIVELNTIYFEHGVSTLSPQARSLLSENLQILREHPECCVFIDGYVDSTEEPRYGLRLAERRARAVYDYYLDGGLARDRFQVRTTALAMPPCDKEDPGIGCRQNRRVDSIPLDCERFRFLLERQGF